MSITINHRTGVISTGSTDYGTSSVTTNTGYAINVAAGDSAIVANSSSSVDLYYNGTQTARAGGFGIGTFAIKEGDVAGDAGARILYFTDSGNNIKASINSGTNSGDLVIDNNIANKDINLTPSGTGNVGLGNFKFDADQTVGAGQDNYVLTYDNGTGLISLEAATGGGLTGTVANDQVVVGTGASSVDSSSTLTYDATTLTISSGLLPGTPSLELSTNRPVLVWNEADAAVDNKRWYMHASAETFQLVAINDANNSSNPVFTVDRTGTTVDSIAFGPFASFEAGLEAQAGAGGSAIFLESTANESGAGLNLPSIRWREADQTSVAGIRGFQNSGSTIQSLRLGTGWFNEKLVLASDNFHSLTGDLNISTDLTFDNVLGDRITLWGTKDNAASYAIGIESGTMYFKADNNYRWYFDQNADGTDTSPEMVLTAAGALRLNGINLDIYDSTNNDILRLSHNGTDAVIESTVGNLNLEAASGSNVVIGTGHDLAWTNASQPWLTLDSTSSGDGWSAQGAGISVGESGKKGSAAIHMTYNGSGYGYIGMGSVNDTAGTGGQPAYGGFKMTYNNYNVQVAGRLFPGTNSNTVQSTKYIEATTGYGSINVSGGGTSSYAGYSINNDIAFMSNGTSHGLYNAGAGEWILLTTDNSTVDIRFNNTQAIGTQNGATDGNSTWGFVRHNNGTNYDIGMNVMPRFVTNASVTLAHQHAGGWMYHSNTTTYTITLNNTAAQGASFPIGGTFFVMNYSTGTVTVNTGSGTLYNPLAGTNTTGSYSIGGNSVATILKYGADVWFLWGDSIT